MASMNEASEALKLYLSRDRTPICTGRAHKFKLSGTFVSNSRKTLPICLIATASMKYSSSVLLFLTGILLLSASNTCAFQSHAQKFRQAVLSSAPSLFFPESLTSPQTRDTTSRLYFFFGGNQETDSKDKELVSFPKLATSNADVKFESLVDFISTWSQKFEDDRKGMGLTTPVKVTNTIEAQEEEEEEDNNDDEDVVEQAGVRIIFQATKTGYKNKKEEDASKSGEGGDKKKKGPPKEGGVEIRVQKLTNGEVQLKARRCDTDEDTVIKEMSEEAIISQLKKAVDVWKKQ